MLLTLSRPTVRERRLHRQTGERAFTLIELLTVIGIIAILSAITFGVVKGVQERAAIGQAKTELAVLATALEAYKGQYGDYPQTGSSPVAANATADKTTVQGKLFNALMGKLGPGNPVTKIMDPIDGKQFVEAGKFSLQTVNLPTTGNTTSVDNAFIDPWGRLYLYYYKDPASPSTWTAPTYILMSVGPTMTGTSSGITVAANGSYTDKVGDASAGDNIYANK